MAKDNDLSLAETFGLTEPTKRIGEVKMALGGDDYTPPTRWGVSSLGMFYPTLSVKTWLGWFNRLRRWCASRHSGIKSEMSLRQ